MSTNEELLGKLQPILDFLAGFDPDRDDAKAKLDAAFPPDSEVVAEVGRVLRAGIDSGELCDREAGGVRFSRLLKAKADDEISIDLVHMNAPGPGHTHPNGEVDLCFAVEGSPKFDDNPPGWTVYPRGSWHVPTVSDGVMDIVYFLPGGAIEFGPKKD
jgi:hypothetical protein